MNNSIGNERKQEENSGQQNQSGNMYSYREDNKYPQETGAMRRSIGEGNPNAGREGFYEQGHPSNYINKGRDFGVPQSQLQYIPQNKNAIPANWLFYAVFAGAQIIIIILFGVCFEWPDDLEPKLVYKECYGEKEKPEKAGKEIKKLYGLFQDINIMVFVGFGILHTYLKHHSWTSITVTFLMATFSIELGIFSIYIFRHAFKEEFMKNEFNLELIIESILNSAAILVSSGLILGKLSLPQYAIMALLETIFCSLNYGLIKVKIEATDAGGCLYVHTFGAIFGLALYLVLFCSTKEKQKSIDNEIYNGGSYISNVTTFIGSLIIWCYFPSFNSALTKRGSFKYRAIINTYLSLCGSVMGTFSITPLFYEGRFRMKQILYGSFVGGVLISGCCSICEHHWAALLVGFLGGGIASFLISIVRPYLYKWGLQESSCILHVHGIPGILGGFLTAIFIGAKKEKDGSNYWAYDPNRKKILQAGADIGAIFITIGISFVGGIASGYLIKVINCGKPENYFVDCEFFEVEDDNLPESNNFPSQIAADANNPSIYQNNMELSGFEKQGVRVSEARPSQPSYN